MHRILSIWNNKHVLKFFRWMENSHKNESWRIILWLQDFSGKNISNCLLKIELRITVTSCPMTWTLVHGESIVQFQGDFLPDKFSYVWLNVSLGHKLNFHIHLAPWRTFPKPWLSSLLSLEDNHPELHLTVFYLKVLCIFQLYMQLAPPIIMKKHLI